MPPHRYGYARVSTLDPSTSIQREVLEAANCDRIFEENASSTTPESRSDRSFLLSYFAARHTCCYTN